VSRNSGETSRCSRFIGHSNGLMDRSTGLIRFGARDYDPSVGRWTCKDPILATLSSVSPYDYCGASPVTASDPSGLYWEYSQGAGKLTHVDDVTGTRTPAGRGYSGIGEGLNNPSMVAKASVGPIPQGWWTIGPAQYGKSGQPFFHLTPDPATFIPPGRNATSFYIHGDNKFENFTGSTGCLVLGRTPRQRKLIEGSGDNRLGVVP
jgi:RHS repeat-associated protein